MFRILITFLGFLVFSSCQPSNPTQKTRESSDHFFHMNIKDEPQTLDPRKARDLKSINLIKILFEGLTRVNQDGVVELALAEKIDASDDGLSFTFHLKKALWTNGDEVSAEDFVSAWKTCLRPDFPSDTAFQMYVIKNAKEVKEGKRQLDEVGIRLIDARTFQVELEKPIPYFFQLLASPPFFPVNCRVDQIDLGWSNHIDHFVSNGPFMLKEWKHQDSLKMIKNDRYWDVDRVKLPGLELVMVQEETEMMLFEKRKLDWAGSPFSTLPIEAIQSLKQERLLQTKEMLDTYFFRTNTEKSPFNHPKMRRAFALSINRKAVVDHVLQGNQIPATGLVPSTFKLTDTPYFSDADSQRAKELFNEALLEMGLSQKYLPEISVLYRSSEKNHLIVQAIQQQWFEAFGIRVKLEASESKVCFDRISNKDYQLAFGDWSADFEDPINFLEVFKYKQGGSNNTCWENAEYIRLLEEASETIDPAKRLKLLAASEKILIEEMPIIPLFYHTMLYVNAPELKDIVLSNSGQLDFKWAYFDKEVRDHL